MINTLRKCIFVAAILQCPFIHASSWYDYDYECEIQSYYYLTENGQVLEHTQSAAMKGDKFRVDRKTGVIDGSITNTGINTRPSIILEGNAASPFVVTTIDAKGRYVYQLNIVNWSKGELKPFVFYRGSDMMSGLCKLSAAN